jgi:glycine betaine transporter
MEMKILLNRHSMGFIITATALGLTAIGTSELLNGISNLLVIMVLPLVFYMAILFFYF